MKIEFQVLLDQLFEQGNLSVLLTMFLLLYGGNAKPKLPNFVDKLFNYAVFRIFILSIIVYKGNSNSLHCILISILFVLVMDKMNKRKIMENFEEEINAVFDSDEEPTIPNDSTTTELANKINKNSLEIDDSIGESHDMDSKVEEIEEVEVVEEVKEVKDVDQNSIESNDLNNFQSTSDPESLNNIKPDDTNITSQHLSNESSTLNLEVEESKDLIQQDNNNSIEFSNDDDFFEDSCEKCNNISLRDFVSKIKSDDFNKDYFEEIKDCHVEDLLKEAPSKYKNLIMKKMDITNNDVNGPIGTAYIDYNDILNRVSV